jgi:F0F1-type ATP synthase membrane subunit c/vacuolar-type H+-ATPase subunit K
MTAAQKSLQSARIFHIALLVAAIAYIVLPLAIAFDLRQNLGSVLPLAMGFTCVAILGVAMYLRKRMISPAEEILRSNPEDKSMALKWRNGVVISLVFCECIVLYGLVLRILGNSWSVCGIFYSVGIFFMLAWWPRLELPPG